MTMPARARPAFRRLADLDALSRAAADELATLARAAVAARGTCALALSGGSTPARLFQLLADRGRDALPWDRVELWWVDERAVPPDHPDSNHGAARAALIEPLGLAASQIHRIAGELADPDAAARAYEQSLVAALGSPPILDIVLLGMGSDGHTASLFPGSPGLDETRRWVIAARATSPGGPDAATRITLTAPAINAARHVRFLVAGPDKAAAVAQVVEGPLDPARYPAQLITRPGGDVVWLLDDAAAAVLRGDR
jgi:6-phosphogluconolactonase